MNGLKVSDVYAPLDIAGSVKTSALQRTNKPEYKKDEVDLSNQARDYQTITKILADLPDIRADVIAGVKAKYDSGDFTVPSSDIAAKLINKWASY